VPAAAQGTRGRWSGQQYGVRKGSLPKRASEPLSSGPVIVPPGTFPRPREAYGCLLILLSVAKGNLGGENNAL